DVMMPGMDGWRVLQSLKAEPRTANIPVVVCSIVDNRPLGYRLGASDYLIKPIHPESLTKSLRNVSTLAPHGGAGYVLVVDDEHGVRELLLSALRRAIRGALGVERRDRSRNDPQGVSERHAHRPHDAGRHERL
ncbi:MAG: response regulator, partial [Acidobacteriota bacterium]